MRHLPELKGPGREEVQDFRAGESAVVKVGAPETRVGKKSGISALESGGAESVRMPGHLIVAKECGPLRGYPEVAARIAGSTRRREGA